MEYIEYKDFPVTEWVAYFENTSQEKSKILSDFRIGCGVVKTDDDVALTYSNGDNGNNTGYEFFEDDLKKPFVLHPNDTGCSCAGASPFMRLHGSTGGINIAVGWTGTWIAEFEKGGWRRKGRLRPETLSHGLKSRRSYAYPPHKL